MTELRLFGAVMWAHSFKKLRAWSAILRDLLRFHPGQKQELPTGSVWVGTGGIWGKSGSVRMVPSVSAFQRTPWISPPVFLTQPAPKHGPTSGPLHLLFPYYPHRLLPGFLPLSLGLNVPLSDISLTTQCKSSPLCPAPLSYFLKFFIAHITTRSRPLVCICLLCGPRLAALGEWRLSCSLFFRSTWNCGWHMAVAQWVFVLLSLNISASPDPFYCSEYRSTHYVIKVNPVRASWCVPLCQKHVFSVWDPREPGGGNSLLIEMSVTWSLGNYTLGSPKGIDFLFLFVSEKKKGRHNSFSLEPEGWFLWIFTTCPHKL